MQLYLTARHLDLTDGLRTHVERRLVQAVDKHAGNSGTTTMEVQLYDAGHRDIRYGCHVLLHLPERHDINIREESPDLYASIDLAHDRLVRELTDFRERRITEARHPVKYYAAKLVTEGGETEEE
jgi:ribosomal subunit interface protein